MSLITSSENAVLVVVDHKRKLSAAIATIQTARANGVPAQVGPVRSANRQLVIDPTTQRPLMEQVTEAITAADYEEALGELAPVFSTTLAVLNTTPEKRAQINAILAAE